MLAMGLLQTGRAGRPEEYFWDNLRKFYIHSWNLPAAVPDRRFIRKAIDVGTTANGIFGAKIHWFQFRQLLARLRCLPGSGELSAAALIERHFPTPRYVRLIREDKVRQAISYYRALQTGEWWKGLNGAAGRATGATPNFREIEELEAMLRRHEAQWDQYFSDGGIAPLLVTYEELRNNYGAVLARILRHIGVRAPASLAIKPPLEKQADDHTEILVHDYITAQRTMRTPAPGLYGLHFSAEQPLDRLGLRQNGVGDAGYQS
jgi:LPS sulfotransferase NodH